MVRNQNRRRPASLRVIVVSSILVLGFIPSVRAQPARPAFAPGQEVGRFKGWEMEIVRRNDAKRGFTVLSKRWIVERMFGWLGRYRRLSKDYEFFTQTGENLIYMAIINLMLHRFAPEERNHNYLPRNQAVAA